MTPATRESMEKPYIILLSITLLSIDPPTDFQNSVTNRLGNNL